MKKHPHLLNIFIIILIAVVLMLPMFMNAYHAGHDSVYHITNIMAIEEQLQAGKVVPSPILDHIADGLGYGSQMFYPPFAHMLTAYLSAYLFQGDVLLSLKVVHFLFLALSGLTMYEASYRFTKNKKVAFFASLIYMSFPYHLSDIYIRDALAECAVFVFLPMILSGVYALLQQDKKHFYPLFILGYTGGILSHLTLMIYFTLFLAVFLFVYRRQVFKKTFMIPFCVATFLVLMLTSFFWVRLLILRISGSYVVFSASEMAKRIAKSGLYPLDYFNIFQGMDVHDVEYYFYPVVILLLIFTFKQGIKDFPYQKGLVVVGILAIILSLKIIPWKYAPDFLKTIQFPWRLLMFSGLVISMLAPFCLRKVRSVWLLSGLTLLLLLSTIPAIHFSSDVVIDMDNIKWNKGMGWQREYLPVQAKKYLAENKRDQEIYSSADIEVKIIKNQVPDLTWQIETKNKVTLELPRIYYKGYVVEDSKGNQYPLRESKNGFLEVDISLSDTYSLTYPGTLGMRIARKVSLFTLLALLGSLLVLFIRNLKRKIMLHF